MKTTEQMLSDLAERIEQNTIAKIKDDPEKIATMYRAIIGEPTPETTATSLTRAQAEEIAVRAKKAIPRANVRVKQSEYSDRLEVSIWLEHGETGNSETRSISDPDAEVESICSDMRESLRRAAVRTREAIATETEMDAE